MVAWWSSLPDFLTNSARSTSERDIDEAQLRPTIGSNATASLVIARAGNVEPQARPSSVQGVREAAGLENSPHVHREPSATSSNWVKEESRSPSWIEGERPGSQEKQVATWRDTISERDKKVTGSRADKEDGRGSASQAISVEEAEGGREVRDRKQASVLETWRDS